MKTALLKRIFVLPQEIQCNRNQAIAEGGPLRGWKIFTEKGIENISGDYNVYQVKNIAKVNGINITLEGNKSKEYNLALWEKDDVSYSISSVNGIDEKL